MSLIDKFDNIQVQNTSRISVPDKEFCESEEGKYQTAVTALRQCLTILCEARDKEEKARNDREYIHSYDDVKHMEDRLDAIKSMFVLRICHYFTSKYGVTLNSDVIERKYQEKDITADNILCEVFAQLGGFSFEEKAQKEIQEKMKSHFSYSSSRREEQLKIRGTKLTLDGYVYPYKDKWSNQYEISNYGMDSLRDLIRALSHFETGASDILNYYSLFNQWRLKESEGAFDKQELGYHKVQSIKLFKNGKVEIEFMSAEQAQEFAKDYCGQTL